MMSTHNCLDPQRPDKPESLSVSAIEASYELQISSQQWMKKTLLTSTSSCLTAIVLAPLQLRLKEVQASLGAADLGNCTALNLPLALAKSDSRSLIAEQLFE